MNTVDPSEMQSRLEVAERDAEEARASGLRTSAQLRQARDELRQARTRIGQLERQLDGHNDQEFDPSAQKGIGAIPIGDFTAGLMDDAEIVERQLGMGPTMRSQLQMLGLGDEQTKHLLGPASAAEAHVATSLAAYPSVLQAAWKARSVLEAGPSDDAEWLRAVDTARQALAALPIAPFSRYLDLDGWDESSDSLPGLASGEG